MFMDPVITLKDFEPLIELVAEGKVNIEPLITNVFPLEQVADAFESFKK